MRYLERLNMFIEEEVASVDANMSYIRKVRKRYEYDDEYEYEEYDERYESSVSEEEYMFYKRVSYDLLERRENEVFKNRREDAYRYYKIKARLEREEAAIY